MPPSASGRGPRVPGAPAGSAWLEQLAKPESMLPDTPWGFSGAPASDPEGSAGVSGVGGVGGGCSPHTSIPVTRPPPWGRILSKVARQRAGRTSDILTGSPCPPFPTFPSAPRPPLRSTADRMCPVLLQGRDDAPEPWGQRGRDPGGVTEGWSQLPRGEKTSRQRGGWGAEGNENWALGAHGREPVLCPFQVKCPAGTGCVPTGVRESLPHTLCGHRPTVPRAYR